MIWYFYYAGAIFEKLQDKDSNMTGSKRRIKIAVSGESVLLMPY